jgi:hypothetical protein
MDQHRPPRPRIADPQRQAAGEAREAAGQRERARRAYLDTPQGRARRAFESGDHVFQCTINVMDQQAIGASVSSGRVVRTSDPSAVLNAVCREGWEIVNGDFVFVEEGQRSRDKLLSSRQAAGPRGSVHGFYLFKRCDENRVPGGGPNPG